MEEVINKPLNLKELTRIILLYHFKLSEEQYLRYIDLENSKFEYQKQWCVFI